MYHPPKILLLLYSSAEYDRAILRGVARYARLHDPWVFSLSGIDPAVPFPLYEALNAITPPKVGNNRKRQISAHKLLTPDISGFIGRIQTPETAEEICKSNLPVIAMDMTADQYDPKNPLAKVSEVRPESVAAGRLAAEHFMERGFQNFAFCGYYGRLWSERRQEGFSQRLIEAFRTCHIYDPPRAASLKSNTHEIEWIQDWIEALPKPIGILGCNDIRARQLLEACIRSECKVPEEVAILGVDNDTLQCEVANPPLSSISFNAEIAGYHAAEHLAAMLRGEAKQKELILAEPLRVHVRRSTDVIAIEDVHVSEAIRFIRDHVRSSMGVEDVVKHCKLSRRALELRFQKHLNRGIREEIERVRLDLVQQFLSETDLPLWKIADITGFSRLTYLSRVFRNATGSTLHQYRRNTRLL